MSTYLDAAQSAVPEIAEYDRRKALVEAKLNDLPATESPDAAARAVAEEAVSTYLDTGKWPDGVEERARAAYIDAVAADAITGHLIDLRARFTEGSERKRLVRLHSRDILEHLDGQLQGVLADVRKDLPALGEVRTAEDAIHAPQSAMEAYRRILALVPTLAGIRDAQWRTLAGTVDVTGPHSPLAHARRDGWGHVRGTAVPGALMGGVADGRFSLANLVWLAQESDAYVPAEASEFIEARQAYRASLADDGSVPREENPYGDAPLIIDLKRDNNV
ncbi:hypothetical protein [Streptomyces sp. NPDC051132]|uniref:hypothetical protein n=1 Tax=unclassified Streptomyces TaxID=2593676 RepID=UPI0034130564